MPTYELLVLLLFLANKVQGILRKCTAKMFAQSMDANEDLDQTLELHLHWINQHGHLKEFFSQRM